MPSSHHTCLSYNIPWKNYWISPSPLCFQYMFVPTCTTRDSCGYLPLNNHLHRTTETFRQWIEALCPNTSNGQREICAHCYTNTLKGHVEWQPCSCTIQMVSSADCQNIQDRLSGSVTIDNDLFDALILLTKFSDLTTIGFRTYRIQLNNAGPSFFGWRMSAMTLFLFSSLELVDS